MIVPGDQKSWQV